MKLQPLSLEAESEQSSSANVTRSPMGVDP